MLSLLVIVRSYLIISFLVYVLFLGRFSEGKQQYQWM